MLSEALQRNAKHEARLSNISDYSGSMRDHDYWVYIITNKHWLVWVEHFGNVNDAIACEKKLKGWRRSRKMALIEQTNPRWFDLSDDWEQQPKFYDSPWETEEMIEDSSLRSE